MKGQEAESTAGKYREKSKFNWRRHSRGQTDTWVLNPIEEYECPKGSRKIRGQQERSKAGRNRESQSKIQCGGNIQEVKKAKLYVNAS